VFTKARSFKPEVLCNILKRISYSFRQGVLSPRLNVQPGVPPLVGWPWQLTYLLTYFMVQDIPWKANSHSACQIISCFLYGTRRFITVLTEARYWTLSWASRIQLAPSISVSLRSIFFQLLRSCQRIGPGLKRFETLRKKLHFYGQRLLDPRPSYKLENHPLSAVRYCLFSIFAATLRIWRPSLHPQPEDAPYGHTEYESSYYFRVRLVILLFSHKNLQYHSTLSPVIQLGYLHTTHTYEGVPKSFRTGRLEREMQIVLSTIRCSFIAILWVGLVSFAAITIFFFFASQRVFIVVSLYFVIDSVQKLLDTSSYIGSRYKFRS
jgi:hypothetical protein